MAAETYSRSYQTAQQNYCPRDSNAANSHNVHFIPDNPVALHNAPAPVTSHVHYKAEYLGPWGFTTRGSRRSFTFLIFLDGLFQGCSLLQAGLHGYAVLRPAGLR